MFGLGLVDMGSKRIEYRRWMEKDGPELPVEFARRSGDGRLTLVLYPEVEPVKVLWSLMDTDEITEAREDLRAREGTIERFIDYIYEDEGYSYVLDSVEAVRGWAQEKGLDGVVWTGLYSNFEDETGMEFTVENAVKYLDGLIFVFDPRKTFVFGPSGKNIDDKNKFENKTGLHGYLTERNRRDRWGRKTKLDAFISGIMEDDKT